MTANIRNLLPSAKSSLPRRNAALLIAALSLVAVVLLLTGHSTADPDSSFIWVQTGNVIDCGSQLRCAEWCLMTPSGPEALHPPCCVEPSTVGSSDPNGCLGGFRHERF